MIRKSQAVGGSDSTAKHQQKGRLLALPLVFLAVCALLWLVASAPGGSIAVVQAQVTTNVVTLRVVNARTEPRAFGGQGVTATEVITAPYRFLISEDNTGDPFGDPTHCFAFTDPPTNTMRDPLYPAECDWPGVHTVAGWAPIYTQGNQDDLNEIASIELPAGKKYLISVMADGYKVGGEHFVVPLEAPGLITVPVQPLPLPPARMIVKVFDDRAMTNGQFDAPVEQGLEGFRVLIHDIAGEITTDLFGNPLCSEYQRIPPGDPNGEFELDAEGNPIPIPGTGGECISGAGGEVTIPFIGPMRYDVLVVPPDGQEWIQTTTLEGSLGWDTWLQEAGTGLDNEFVVAAEPFPWTIFGFVKPATDTLTSTLPTEELGSISGVIMATSSYLPSNGGLPHLGDIWGGLMGVKLERPIAYPWIALNDLQWNDEARWVGRGEADGSFHIPDVPPGNYLISYWDEKHHYILDWVQLTVNSGQETDIGVRTMVGWFAEWYGHVFLDSNENGRMDPGEPGIPDYTVVMRDRDNTEIDRMSIAAVTDGTGFYELEKGYPMTFWMVLEAASDLFQTTGVTFQASNQPEETTILGNGVDVSILPILSQKGRLDWGVKPYDPGTNGGIAGSVFYDTVRAEDDAAYAGAEPWQPGIPDLPVHLYATVPCGTNPGAPCNDSEMYELDPSDLSYAKGPLLNSTTTERFVRPKDCTVRDVNGDPITVPSLPPSTGGYDCLEGPLVGIQFGTEWSELPGNWGFGDIITDPVTGLPLPGPEPIPPGDYLVEVVVPDDPVFGRPLYTPTREEDINMFDGDEFYPFLPPQECAGPMHIVDVLNVGDDGYELPWAPGEFSTPVYNPNFEAEGGSRFEGQQKPLCNVKLVNVANQKGVAPIFQFWTPVPIPGRWRGYVIDDLNLTTDPRSLTFGEKLGIAHSPVGIYDFTGQLVHTMHSDFHGVFEVLLPSDATYNAPAPGGMLASVYYIYGNDPGQPGNLNDNYNPQYRSIGTSFEIYPGTIVPADLAPIQNGVGIWGPDSQTVEPADCSLEDTTPQIFAVDKPYVYPPETLTIQGTGFGAQGLFSRVTLGSIRLPITSWDDSEIVVEVPDTVRPRPWQLSVLAGNRQKTVYGLTIHVLGNPYAPIVREVGPGRAYDTIQSALDASALTQSDLNYTPVLSDSLIVVYPGVTYPFTNPLGIWYENPIIYSPVKLQGVGPGGVYPDGSGVLGSILDGRSVGGDTPYVDEWRANLSDIWLSDPAGGWDGSRLDGDGNPRVPEGQVVTVLAKNDEFTNRFPVAIDGFTIQGGDQQGIPTFIDQNGLPAEVVKQGGGIFVNAYANYMRITNNIIQSNGGAYAGGIRVGTPHIPEPLADHQNDNMTISFNRILANGGSNLAGGIGLFNGTQNYVVSYNDLCGNFSAEYGGGISHYGYSPGGAIHHNRIYFNRSYDEGGGIMIAGELPAPDVPLSAGAGRVKIYNNVIQANLGNDDGGGIRFLMAGNFPIEVYNNMIVNNISTHEGGGISLNDAPDVRIYNNTIAKNLTTATSTTSNGLPAPAGLSTSRNSVPLQATLPAGAPTFSDPVVFNNIFWDNRAGAWVGGGVTGLGQEGDPGPILHWDLGVAGTSDLLSPSHCLLQTAYLGADGTNIVGSDPLFVEEYDVGVRVYPWRGNPAFIGADIVAVQLPPNLLGDYRITDLSPARNMGIDQFAEVFAPDFDIEDGYRPVGDIWDAGADESIVE